MVFHGFGVVAVGVLECGPVVVPHKVRVLDGTVIRVRVLLGEVTPVYTKRMSSVGEACIACAITCISFICFWRSAMWSFISFIASTWISEVVAFAMAGFPS